MSDYPRNWVCGCGQRNCDGQILVKNAAIVRTGGTCSNCEDFGKPGDEVADVTDRLVSSELGWCGCGIPSEVDRMMLAYLEARSHPEFPKPPAEGVSDDAERLLSYIADDLYWTEHGGGVGGAWLTDDGKEALANLRKARG